MTDNGLPLDALLPLYVVDVRLQWLKDVNCSPFHQPLVYAWLRNLLQTDEELSRFLCLDTPESSRVSYQKGDYYQLRIILSNPPYTLVTRLFSQLQALPQSARVLPDYAAFNNNLVLTELTDVLSGRVVQSPQHLSPVTLEHVQADALVLRQHHSLTWRFSAPCRLLKPIAMRQNSKGEARFCRDAQDITAELLLERVYTGLDTLIHQHTQRGRTACPPVTGVVLNDEHWFWLDNQYSSKPGRSKYCGGMLGQANLLFKKWDTKWAEYLVLASWLGIGQNRSFGLGRFCLLTEALILPPRPSPAKSWLEHLQAPRLIHQALQKSHATKLETLPSAEQVQYDLSTLGSGTYSVPALQGRVIEKAAGADAENIKYRPLAVPPLRDKVLQRVVQQGLLHSLEAIMYDCSYGYRPNRSRLNAILDIRKAYQQGYKWVFESDINSYFDSVNHRHIARRLMGVYQDSDLVKTIMAWVAAPVDYYGQRIVRDKGLPQGSPISPLLANLVLDDFDNDMQSKGFRLVRYADDFIVLCKNEQRAHLAQAAAAESLAEHGLTLNKNKTAITHLDKGFHFLGYLFVGELALESKTKSYGSGPAIAPDSWLASYYAQQEVNKRKTSIPVKPDCNTHDNKAPLVAHKHDSEYKPVSTSDPAPVSVVAAKTPIAMKFASAVAPDLAFTNSTGERTSLGTVLCVTGSACVLHSQQRRLIVHRESEQIVNQPFSGIASIILFGHHQVTSYCLHHLLENNIAVHYATAMGRYLGVSQAADTNSADQTLWHYQQCLSDDVKLHIARQLVMARVRHCQNLLRKQKHPSGKLLADRTYQIQHASSIATLRGYEGASGQIYFAALRDILPEWMGFQRRQRQPPPDPANALLSLGYTLLYGYSDSILRSVRLLPWQGVYHQPKGSHAALASDLMEPFRHLVERCVLKLVNRRQLSDADFTHTDNGCRMSQKAKALFLAELLNILETPVKSLASQQPASIHQHLYQQALSLVQQCFAKGEFNVWRTR
ncbi:CRISPR-associated endonuclease Cas1 [Alteromonas gilva]|uniref:CRISPR-associated endonuclease Cas1 n=1 Tax=Alteromonas gilva TaxID=2987522 RepID=A0ABT5L4U2_9ALTE|nr:CRISPR-associated endonuclease Cas1 [Alteromonas gilva]MDC8832066.1 CRISPR-associated endonuclease Cas1 [Alteromonas gilva]